MGMDEEAVSFPLESSSGSESGWTMYLNHSFERSSTSFTAAEGAGSLHSGFIEAEKEEDVEEEEEEEEEEESLSMLSDASSGPQQFHEEEDNCDEEGCFCSASSSAPLVKKKSSKRRRVEAKERAEQSFYLEDTASSQGFLFPKKSLDVTLHKQSSMEDLFDFSAGFSATHFNKHSNNVQSSSIPVKPTPAKPVCSKESRRNIKLC